MGLTPPFGSVIRKGSSMSVSSLTPQQATKLLRLGLRDPKAKVVGVNHGHPVVRLMGGALVVIRPNGRARLTDKASIQHYRT